MRRDVGNQVAHAHGFRWGIEDSYPEQAFSVRDAIRRARDKKLPTMCLKELIQKLQPAIRVPTKLVARKECLVRCILDLDLEAFVPKKSTHVKPSLSVVSLRAAAEIWRRYHPMNDKDELKDLKGTLPYPVLWMHLKRLALKACGLCVVLSPSHRVYFEEPFHRPHLAPGDHPKAKDGKWREKVVVPGSYAKTVEDEEMQDDLRREKKYVRSAAYEQAMGRGGVPEEEVPTPLDDAALDCPDTATKAEWDALWPFERCVSPVPILAENEGLGVIREGDERLLWALPERERVVCQKGRSLSWYKPRLQRSLKSRRRLWMRSIQRSGRLQGWPWTGILAGKREPLERRPLERSQAVPATLELISSRFCSGPLVLARRLP